MVNGKKQDNMSTSTLEEMEAGGEVISNRYGSRKFWGITLFCSIAAMSISLLMFCLTGKANDMGGATATAFTSTAHYLIIQYTVIGAMYMCCGPCRTGPPPGDSPQDMEPVEMAGLELVSAVLICFVTFWFGKNVEVFVFTMSFITGLVAICQLLSLKFGKDHL